jgi:hypothetical protein
VVEPAAVLKNVEGVGTQPGSRRVPVHGVRKVHIEICNNRLAINSHVSGRDEIVALGVLEVVDQGLLRIAAWARIPLDGSLVDHDGEGEAGMIFRFGFDQLRGLIDGIVRPVPVYDQAINAPADHVLDLPFHLRRIGRTVADVHVMPGPEPGLHMHVYLGGSARIKQGVYVNLADIAGTLVTVRLTGKGIGGAGVV